MTDKVVYLMRGLPSCGKSFTARRLAGTAGVVLETDEYFYTQVGPNPESYDFREDLLPAARQWIFERFERAIAEGSSPIVIDRGNGLNEESQAFARFAVDHGYRVELRESDSPWWQEIRNLLREPRLNRAALDAWSDRLAEMSRSTHRVSAATIRVWMAKWRWDLTVEEILNLRPALTPTPPDPRTARPRCPP